MLTRTKIAWFLGSALIVGDSLGLIGLAYPVGMNNQPLINPQRVSAIEGHSITLADARVLDLDLDPDLDLGARLARSGRVVDVEVEEDGVARVYEVQHGYCGTPWARFIQIRLIPIPVAANRRNFVGRGAVRSKASSAP